MTPAPPIDRLSLRAPLPGLASMRQTWGSLLFLHWPVAADRLLPLVPPGLELDVFDGTAWVGVVPFTMWGIGPPAGPPFPLISRSHELNVRTYVHHRGVPGVLFLSLDAANASLVWSARQGFRLPYYRAEIDLEQAGATTRYHSRRTHRGAPPATFAATWTVGERLPEAAPPSLEFFLTERYCLYAPWAGAIRRTRIFHAPWPLARATVEHLDSTMLEAHGLPTPEAPPHVLAAAEPIRVRIGFPSRV